MTADRVYNDGGGGEQDDTVVSTDAIGLLLLFRAPCRFDRFPIYKRQYRREKSRGRAQISPPPPPKKKLLSYDLNCTKERRILIGP